MSDLLEFLLNCALEVLCDWGDLETYWRFGLPTIVALLVVSLIEWRVSDSAAQTALSIPVLLAGVATGTIWQIRKK
jgi:hypothetical protein